jgi:hypothetical protein
MDSHARTPACRRSIAVAALLVTAMLAACSDDPSATSTSDPTITPADDPADAVGPLAPHATPPSTDTDEPGSSTSSSGSDPGPEASGDLTIVRFDMPSEVPCTGGNATATADYETTGAETVAFLVDQASVAGGPVPPLSGNHELDLSCGATHIVVLVAVGGGAQVLASNAVTVAGPSDPPRG